MKIAIIDNGSRYLGRLKQLLRPQKLSVINYQKVKDKQLQKFDFVILAGGHKLSVVNNEKRFRKEIKFIRQRRKPLLGICLGFELIAYAFGAKLKRMAKKERGIIALQTTRRNSILGNNHSISVYESHRWIVKKLPRVLRMLAKSKDGIEALVHKTKPIYGFQFHPEMFVRKTDGRKIFDNLLTKIVKKHLSRL